jgi:AGCS family alanine or glycine:cation symporter
VGIVIIGATLKLDLVWNIADTLNGFMALPNLVALLGLSGVVIKLTKEHFSK